MKDRWSNFLLQNFTFNVAQRRGITVLCIIVIASIFYPLIISSLRKDSAADFHTYKAGIDSLQALMNKAVASDSSNKHFSFTDLNSDKKDVEVFSIALFPFDPNTASHDDLKKLGLSEKVIKTILNYRSKGGKFYAKEDFKKIYGLKNEDYTRLDSFIQITSAPKNESPVLQTSLHSGNSEKHFLVNLNTADSLQLLALPGIGETLSSRIMKFRGKLGGFYSVEQLKEVYGFKQENFDMMKDKVSVNIADIIKIHINEVSLEELKRHPYFKPIAIPVINYRDQHGNFSSIEDLKNIDVITEENYNKITPYLEL